MSGRHLDDEAGPDETDLSRSNVEVVRRREVEARGFIGAVAGERYRGIEPPDLETHPGSISKVGRRRRAAGAALRPGRSGTGPGAATAARSRGPHRAAAKR